MSTGAFRTRINEACDLVDKLGLLWRRNLQAYAQPEIAELRQMTYLAQWQRFAVEYAYDIQLADLSLIQFRPQPTREFSDAVSFIYLGSPLDILSYREWLIDQGFTFEVVRDEFLEEYEEYVGTCEARTNPVYIRYDYSPHQYTTNEHPAAHVHIGFDNQIRLGALRLWNPVSFMLFVLRQVYPHAWRVFKVLNNSEVCKHVRERLPEIEPPLWCDDDDCEVSFW